MKKRFFIVGISSIVILLLAFVIFGVDAYLSSQGSEDCLIAHDGSYVICGGEKYVPAGEGIAAQYSPTDRIIAENVPIENGDFLDRYFIYGYIIYGNEDGSVIRVDTAESSDSAAGYYVKESCAEDVPGTDVTE